jgi:hypothetical protein
VSRYRVKRDFDELHKRDFVEQCFSEIYRFFEASVSELNSIADIETRLSPFGPDYFACTLINRGLRRGYATVNVRRGGDMSPIDFFFGEQNESRNSHGGFRVESDEYRLYLRPSMFGGLGRGEAPLTAREAAETIWDQLLEKVGIAHA